MSNDWLLRLRPNPSARVRLFCFPHAGGGAASFRSWPDLIPASVDVCAVQLPGREGRFLEPLVSQLQTVVEAIEESIYPYQVSMPFAFFGHSMGALLAFEVAHVLIERHHVQPLHLFVSARLAPQEVDLQPPLFCLPEPQLLEELSRWGDIPEPVLQDRELLGRLLPMVRADLKLNETYSYKLREPLACDISAFGGTHDLRVREGDLAKWSLQTAGAFYLRMFSGGHFFTQSSRNELLQEIRRTLRQKLDFDL